MSLSTESSSLSSSSSVLWGSTDKFAEATSSTIVSSSISQYKNATNFGSGNSKNARTLAHFPTAYSCTAHSLASLYPIRKTFNLNYRLNV